MIYPKCSFHAFTPFGDKSDWVLFFSTQKLFPYFPYWVPARDWGVEFVYIARLATAFIGEITPNALYTILCWSQLIFLQVLKNCARFWHTKLQARSESSTAIKLTPSPEAQGQLSNGCNASPIPHKYSCHKKKTYHKYTWHIPLMSIF